VNEKPGTNQFRAAIQRARQNASVVFAWGATAEELLAAIPGAPVQISTTDHQANGPTVSYYATYPNRPPTVGSFTLINVDAPGEVPENGDDMLDEEMPGFLEHVQALYAENVNASADSLVAPQAYVTSTPVWAGDIDWGYSCYYLDGGNVVYLSDCYEHFQAWWESGEGSPTYDWYYAKASLLTDPTDPTQWQNKTSTFKYQANGTGRTIVDYDVGQDMGSSTWSVSVDGNGGSYGWSWTQPNLAPSSAQSLPSWFKAIYSYALNTPAGRDPAWTRPGFTEKVSQGSAFSVYMVGTLVYQKGGLFPQTKTVSNIDNKVVTFSHP